MIRIGVAYATFGRPDLVKLATGRLGRQTRKPDAVVVSAVSEEDVRGLEAVCPDAQVLLGSKGLCAQRNRAMAWLEGRADIVIFFDDDFIPSDAYIQETHNLFARCPELVGLTGRLIYDGIKTPGLSFPEGEAYLGRDVPPADPALTQLKGGLYGCNMAIRLSVTEDMWFDEDLPLYGWLEDLDFTYRLHERGKLYASERLAGVHLGAKGGRTSGVKLGYSQIANPIYMARKRSGPRLFLAQQMARNIASNLALSFRPEPYVDRVGRLRGNLLALFDLLSRRLEPRRILQMS